jgi:hypothetical protein
VVWEGRRGDSPPYPDLSTPVARPLQMLRAPSIERLFARWVGDHNCQPSAIGSFHLRSFRARFLRHRCNE